MAGEDVVQGPRDADMLIGQVQTATQMTKQVTAPGQSSCMT
jgi:hypothetical protein